MPGPAASVAITGRPLPASVKKEGSASSSRSQRAMRPTTTLTRRDGVSADCLALVLQHGSELCRGSAVEQFAVSLHPRDQVTNQGPDIPLSTRRGVIPLLRPDLPDKLHHSLG